MGIKNVAQMYHKMNGFIDPSWIMNVSDMLWYLMNVQLKVAESMVPGTNNGLMDMPHTGSRYMSYATGGNGPHYMQQAPVVQQHEQQQQQQGFTGGKMGRTPSMQRVASLEHLQKRIRGGPACNNPAWGGSFEADGQSMLEQREDWSVIAKLIIIYSHSYADIVTCL